MKKLVLVLIVLVVALVGFVGVASAQTKVNVIVDSITSSTLGMSIRVFRITDKDTNNVCYVYDGVESGNIFCLPINNQSNGE